MRCFGAAERLTPRSCNDILEVASSLPIEMDSDLLKDEWLMLQKENEDCKFKNSMRIDDYWKQFFKRTVDDGVQMKFPIIASVIKAAMSLVHGSADIERRFSDSGRILTDDQAHMSKRTLDCLLIVKGFIKLYSNRVHSIYIPKKLVTLAFKVCANYKNYLEEQKKKRKKK